MAVGHSLAVMNNRYRVKQLTQKGKSLTASATVVQTISNKFTAVVSNVVKWLDESHPMEHYGRHLEFHSFLVCGEAAHTKREKLDSFSDGGSNNFKQVHSSCIQPVGTVSLTDDNYVSFLYKKDLVD